MVSVSKLVKISERAFFPLCRQITSVSCLLLQLDAETALADRQFPGNMDRSEQRSPDTSASNRSNKGKIICLA